MKKEKVRVGFRIPFDLNTWLIEEAARAGITKNAYIITLLRSILKERSSKETHNGN